MNISEIALAYILFTKSILSITAFSVLKKRINYSTSTDTYLSFPLKGPFIDGHLFELSSERALHRRILLILTDIPKQFCRITKLKMFLFMCKV